MSNVSSLPVEFQSSLLTAWIVCWIAYMIMVLITSILAHKKGRNVIGHLFLTVILGPIGLIIAIVSPECRPVKTIQQSTPTPTPTPTTTPTASGGSQSSSQPSQSGTPTFGRGSGTSSAKPASSGSKGNFRFKICPHCGGAVSSSTCPACGKQNNLFS